MKKYFLMVIVMVIVAIGVMHNVSNAEEYLQVPVYKLSSPAFAKDLSNKKIIITPTVLMTSNIMIDLPSEYRNDYIRFTAVEGSSSFLNVLAQKHLSDQMFEIASKDMISQRDSNIRIYGKTRLMSQGRVFGGGQQDALIFIVDKIETSTPEVNRTKNESTKFTLDIPNTLVEKLLMTLEEKGKSSVEEVVLMIISERYQ